MPTRTSGLLAALTAMAIAAIAGPAVAQGDKGGRFAMSPVEGGMMRLDTETGAMSLCKRAGDQWACEPLPDSARTQAEALDKTKRELAEARATIRHLEEMLLGKDGDMKPADKPTFRLPSEQDVDQAMDYVERMLKKFRERLKQLEGQEKGTAL